MYWSIFDNIWKNSFINIFWMGQHLFLLLQMLEMPTILVPTKFLQNQTKFWSLQAINFSPKAFLHSNFFLGFSGAQCLVFCLLAARWRTSHFTSVFCCDYVPLSANLFPWESSTYKYPRPGGGAPGGGWRGAKPPEKKNLKKKMLKFFSRKNFKHFFENIFIEIRRKKIFWLYFFTIFEKILTFKKKKKFLYNLF